MPNQHTNQSLLSLTHGICKDIIAIQKAYERLPASLHTLIELTESAEAREDIDKSLAGLGEHLEWLCAEVGELIASRSLKEKQCTISFD